MSAIRLVVGLGNPGSEYQHTRHNVGANFVYALSRRFDIPLKVESRFKSELGRGSILGQDLRLMVPTTYMNVSGEAVALVSRFYKIGVDEMLVAYDEMAFEPGLIRVKTGGGDNGHNGIRSVVRALGNDKGFHRLRIGVGHPGDRRRVTAYLTSARVPAQEQELLDAALQIDADGFGKLLAGDMAGAMNALHGPVGGPAAGEPAPRARAPGGGNGGCESGV